MPLDVFARSPGGGLILPGSGLAIRHYELIIAVAARHRLPAIYPIGFFVTSGGLISYGLHSVPFDMDEVTRPEVADAGSIERDHRASVHGAF